MRYFVLILSIFISSASFAELAPDVLMDKYFLELKGAIKEQQYKKVASFLEKLDKLDVKKPNDFDLVKGKIYFHNNEYEKSVIFVKEYINTQGRKASHYEEALALLIAGEKKLEYINSSAELLESKVKLLADLLSIGFSSTGAKEIRFGPYKGKTLEVEWNIKNHT